LKKEKKIQINLAHAITGGLVGALIGTLIAALVYQSDAINYQTILWGFFIGSLGGFISIAAYMYWHAMSRDTFERENDLRREAIRRQEAERFERHEELVYYDAGREQSAIYKLFCHPHYGKITSERIIYSASVESFRSFWNSDNFTLWGLWKKLFFFWEKRVEQLTYNCLLDASVEQTCDQFLTDTGTLVIYCQAEADTSVIERYCDSLFYTLLKKQLFGAYINVNP
jgi:ABC-type nickel/cobalt efflux system permease component RcnA